MVKVTRSIIRDLATLLSVDEFKIMCRYYRSPQSMRDKLKEYMNESNDNALERWYESHEADELIIDKDQLRSDIANASSEDEINSLMNTNISGILPFMSDDNLAITTDEPNDDYSPLPSLNSDEYYWSPTFITKFRHYNRTAIVVSYIMHLCDSMLLLSVGERSNVEVPCKNNPSLALSILLT
jgi:hypothetical protein